jgi:hypothetical protein
MARASGKLHPPLENNQRRKFLTPLLCAQGITGIPRNPLFLVLQIFKVWSTSFPGSIKTFLYRLRMTEERCRVYLCFFLQVTLKHSDFVLLLNFYSPCYISFPGTFMHSSEYKNSDFAKSKKILLVGSELAATKFWPKFPKWQRKWTFPLADGLWTPSLWAHKFRISLCILLSRK